MLSPFLPNAVSGANSRILVQPTLQVFDSSQETNSTAKRIFAVGDVADHPGPRMARVGWRQAAVVQENIMELIRGRKPSRTYAPNVFIEGAIKLSLGKTHCAIYAVEANGSELLVSSRSNQIDLGIKNAWRSFGVKNSFGSEENGPVKQD